MIERKLYFSKSINEIELIRSLALFNMSSFGSHFIKLKELIDLVSEHNNFYSSKELITREELPFLLIDLLKGQKGLKLTDFSDYEHIAASLNSARGILISNNPLDELNRHIENDQLSSGVKLLPEIYSSYINYLNENNKNDDISLLREVMANIKDPLDRIYIFKEEGYTPLEIEFLNRAFKEVISISVIDLFNNEKSDIVPQVDASYGEDNEVKEILTKIFENNIPLDQVVIYCANDKYLDIFYDICRVNKIPLSLTGGLSIKESKAFNLLAILLKLEQTYLFSKTGYKSLFNSYSFDLSSFNPVNIPLLLDLFGSLKISYNKHNNEEKINRFLSGEYKNKVYEDYKVRNKDFDNIEFEKEFIKLTSAFSNGIRSIVNEYCSVDENDAYESLSKKEILSKLEKASTIEDINIKNSYLKGATRTSIQQVNSVPGSLTIGRLENIVSAYRPYVFVCGLSSNNFPGKAVDDFIINDKDALKINEDVETSEDRVIRKSRSFETFIDILSRLNAKSYLTYSFYSLSDVKEVNPCSYIFSLVDADTLKATNKTKDHRNNKISRINKFIEAAVDVDATKTNEAKDYNFDEEVDLLSRGYSPSSIDLFFTCEYRFLLSCILGIKVEQEEDIFVPIDALHFGNIFHMSMEYLYHSPKCSKDEFVSNGLRLLKDYFTYNVPTISTEKDTQTFEKCLENAYYFIQKQGIEINKVEQWAGTKYKELKLYGKYDALGKIGGSNVLLDYKTGRHIKHKKNDPITGRQLALYYYMLSKSGTKINYGYYFYPRMNMYVPIEPEAINEEALEAELDIFINALKARSFAKTTIKNNCKYCEYNKMCEGGKKDE